MPIRRVGVDFAGLSGKTGRFGNGRCASRSRISCEVPFGKLLESGGGPPRSRLREALGGPAAAPLPPAPKRARLSEAAKNQVAGSFSGTKRLSLATTAESSQLVKRRRLSGPTGTSGLSRAHLRGVDGVVPCVCRISS